MEDRDAASGNAVLLDPEKTYALLDRFGIPLIPQRVVYSAEPEDVVRAAEEFGYPVVLKAFTPSLLHKSDVGGVRMYLHDDHQVQRAAVAIQERIPDLTGYVLQTQAPAGHELIIGGKRDPAFGPVVLAGLGGVWTELLDDVSVRVAPIDLDDARTMIQELRGARLLQGYRGSRAADLDALANALVNVSRLITETAEVAELDLNPIIAGADGVVAVDARVFWVEMPEDRGPEVRLPIEDTLAGVHRILAPESIAVVGASSDTSKPGGRLFSYLTRHGFSGNLYPVNRGATEVMGYRSYPSVDALPKVPDLACIMVPALSVPDVIRECGRKGIHAAIVYPAGFTETGPDGAELQADMMQAARESGVRLCGPNTAGVVNVSRSTCAAFGMAFEVDRMPEGDIAFLTQSGALGSSLLSRTWESGIGFSHWVCSGNEADLTLSDYLLYLVDDPEARVIAVFMETLRDPETFLRAAERARALGKPIVVYKTGRSQIGQRAVQSHTGSLAGDDRVYDAVFRSAGVARVHDLQALIDAAVALAWQPLPRGRGVGVISASGGACSVIADESARHGLSLPALAESTLDRIREVIPPFGAAQNPVDVTVEVTRNPEMIGKVAEILLAEESIDALMVLMTTNADPPALEVARGVAQASGTSRKPILVTRVGADFLAPESVPFYRESRLPLYPMPDRAVKALRAMVDISESHFR